MNTFPTVVLSCIVSALLLLLPVTCSRSPSQAERGCATQTLHFANQTEPQDLDPHIVTGVPEFHILQALFEGLVIAEPEALRPVPGIAHSWDVCYDGLTYTFHLRRDARWSNGDTVRAGDFKFSWQRILSPALGSEYAYMLYCIRGAEAYHKGTLTDFTDVGIHAVNDSTLVVELCRPTPYFLSLLSHHSWFPVHPPTILKFGAIDSRGTPWTQPGNIVTNGPFTLSRWDVNTIVKVDRNPAYYDHEKVRLSAICFYPIDNQQTEERAFRTGEVHLTTNCPVTKLDWYRQNRPEALRVDPYLGTYFYVFNIRKPPFDNPLVRSAFTYAIDREALVTHVLKGGQLPAVSFTPPGTARYQPDSVLSFDTVAALRALAEAGYGPGKKPFPGVQLLYNTSEMHHTLAQAVQQMWKRYLGIEVELVNQEWKVYLTSKQRGDFNIARMGWIGDYNDPMTFLDMWVSGGGNNNSGWSDARYDSLIADAFASVNDTARYAVLRSAENLLLDAKPVLPVYYYNNVYLLSPSVKGWYPNILNIHNYKYVWLASPPKGGE